MPRLSTPPEQYFIIVVVDGISAEGAGYVAFKTQPSPPAADPPAVCVVMILAVPDALEQEDVRD
eukprot:3144780-Pleurochrysis_carterae.AAC.1